MKRFGESYELDESMLGNIASYMDDEKRELIHYKFAPCSPEKFLIEYLKTDPGFIAVIKEEFGIDLDIKYTTDDLRKYAGYYGCSETEIENFIEEATPDIYDEICYEDYARQIYGIDGMRMTGKVKNMKDLDNKIDDLLSEFDKGKKRSCKGFRGTCLLV